MEKKDLVTVRDMQPGDRNFIFATWLRGLYYGNSFFGEMPKDAFMKHYHDVLEKLLTRPTPWVRVACLKDDPEVILGYAIGRVWPGELSLDWIFVKSPWRKIGIAKSLVPPGVTTITHLTKVGKALKPSAWVFNPFFL